MGPSSAPPEICTRRARRRGYPALESASAALLPIVPTALVAADPKPIAVTAPKREKPVSNTTEVAEILLVRCAG